METINDIDGNVVNLFRMIREHGNELSALVQMTPWARDEYYASFEQTEVELEAARRFLVRCWQAFGAKVYSTPGWRHEAKGTLRASTVSTWQQLPKRILAILDRLKNAQIENKPALELIPKYHYHDTLIYADPPYPLGTRHGKMYAHEMTDDDHYELLEQLDRHPGPVLLSGYDCELYNERLRHWIRKTTKTLAEGGRERVEVLWLNPLAARELNYSLFSI